ncbi:unnamed protein product [Trifolium pratense]|uniref:Uncharacterized protein n=1 Tax=Trifolium pratense TaxID=57577 RepID=A0ACB0I925_TRIPR|nr:unnamed protein product [Trifolium pratense]
MAEDEEDDESFGDFKFASFSNQQFPSTSVQNNGWGGFNGTTTTASKPFDLFTVSSDPLAKRVNVTNGVSVQANKARGAIPLSIFGEEEDQEPVSGSGDFFSSNGGGVVKNGSGLNGGVGGGVGISDLISNLYHQKTQVSSVNGSVSMSNVDSSNRSDDGAMKLNVNANDLNRDEDEEDDDGWEFKSAEWENGNRSLDAKVETPKHGNSAVGVLPDSSAEISNKVDDWQLGFEFSPISASHSPLAGPKSESNQTGDGLTMFNQTFGKLPNTHSWPGPNQSLEAPKKDNIYPTHNGSVTISNVDGPNPSADGPMNSNTSDLNQDEDDDGWEFKSAEWGTGNNNSNVKVEAPKHGNSVVGEWHLGFEFSPSSAAQSSQAGPKSESNESGAGLTLFNQTFEKEAPKKDNIYPTAIEALNDDGGASDSTLDPSLASQSHQSNGWGFGFDLNTSSMVEDSLFSESYFKGDNNHDENNKSNASPTNMNVDSDVNVSESKDAVTEKGIKHEKPLITSENRREALPLSIFGDDMPDTNEHSVSQDLSPYPPVSPTHNNLNNPGSNLSINDLIWTLYSQTENKTSPNATPKASGNETFGSPELSGSNLDNSDDFDDDFGDFKDASPETTFTQESAQNTSFNHPTEFNENGLQTSLKVLNSDLINGNDGFEDDSWEFKDAISRTGGQDQASTIDHRDLLTQLSTELELSDCVEFFSNLKDELCSELLFHLQNLKKAQDVAAQSGEEAKVKALEVEIQEFSEILHQHHMSVPVEYLSENYSPRNVNFDELLKVLKEPKFLPLESEYQLPSRLAMAETDIKSAMELLKDAVSTLRILKLGSGEEQSNYLTIWSKIAFVCSQELKHGAYIWTEAVKKNVHDQLLSIPKGVQYVHALGEIYRVVEIVRVSAKLHKPWMLSGSIDRTSLFALLGECNSLWLASGLEEALSSISNHNNFDVDGISRELVQSIKYIHELDEHALQSHVISGEETMCQLSALPADCLPGLNFATWNGKPCFVKLANLWLNLISSDPPK